LQDEVKKMVAKISAAATMILLCFIFLFWCVEHGAIVRRFFTFYIPKTIVRFL
jgi:uncharacterized membrane protein